MNRSSLLNTLEGIVGFVESDGYLLLPEDARRALLEQARTLLHTALEPGENLYVGILGGTGVVKSTLINALAREKISDPSDKRPFTDRAVLYRHKDAHLRRSLDHDSTTQKLRLSKVRSGTPAP